MSWHVAPSAVRSYREGALDRVAAASLEAHVTVCDECRRLLSVDREWLERAWMGVADRVEPGTPRLVERALATVGVPDSVARIIAVSPALRISFLLAVTLVMGFAAVASAANPTGDAYKVFLAVAPLLPVAGVAFAYGRLVDPAHELAMVTPIDTFRVLILRTVTVLVVSIAIGLLVSPLVPAPGTLEISAWLAPALALTLITLALSSRFESWLSAVLVSGGWIVLMLLASAEGYETFDATAQGMYTVLAVAAGGVVAMRRDRYDREGQRR